MRVQRGLGRTPRMYILSSLCIPFSMKRNTAEKAPLPKKKFRSQIKDSLAWLCKYNFTGRPQISISFLSIFSCLVLDKCLNHCILSKNRVPRFQPLLHLIFMKVWANYLISLCHSFYVQGVNNNGIYLEVIRIESMF